MNHLSIRSSHFGHNGRSAFIIRMLLVLVIVLSSNSPEVNYHRLQFSTFRHEYLRARAPNPWAAVYYWTMAYSKLGHVNGWPECTCRPIHATQLVRVLGRHASLPFVQVELQMYASTCHLCKGCVCTWSAAWVAHFPSLPCWTAKLQRLGIAALNAFAAEAKIIKPNHVWGSRNINRRPILQEASLEFTYTVLDNCYPIYVFPLEKDKEQEKNIFQIEDSQDSDVGIRLKLQWSLSWIIGGKVQIMGNDYSCLAGIVLITAFFETAILAGIVLIIVSFEVKSQGSCRHHFMVDLLIFKSSS